MKVKVEGNSLQEGLRKVIGVANAKISPSILGNVLVEAKDGKMSLTASNLDITLATSVACEVEDAGSTTVPAKMLQNVISALPVGIVYISVDDNEKMKITSGESSFRISGLPSREFPKMANISDETSFRMSAKDLRSAIRKTAYAQSIDSTRRSLAGVLFDFNGEHLKTVATDGRRMSISLVKASWDCADTKFTLPTDAVKEIQRLISDEGEVTIRYSGTLAFFNFENAETTMSAKVICEAYPNYTHVIPKQTTNKADCDRLRMIDMMVRAKVMAVNAGTGVKLSFENGSLDAMVFGVDDGEGRDKFAIKYNGEKTEFIFNPSYMHDSLSAFDSDFVTIEFTTSGSPIVIKGEEENGLAVLMPLRMN